MLRSIITGIAIAAVLVALILTIQDPLQWPSLALALLFATACRFERRYRAGRSGQAPDARFRPTGERFVDPETGRVTMVWTDPATGERRYVDDGAPAGPTP
ncbi:hypothetical protein [Sphingomonas abietis]|uniref:Uncharacterized protein n=1 Tax=Sphingomonas abietis TaxID=3012344 RepID=A0ABY7NPT5_9SPHN|nr:hypothetical protein [Sphingomonas abietis]WBO23547.1 hypothetical protein PBT88_05305 [Sphingomonas abietis]